MENTYKIIFNPKDKLNDFITFIMAYSPIDEKWKELILGCGQYFVSSKGRVLSLCNNKPRLLKQFICNGYYYVSIDGHDHRVNRLGALAFLDNPDHKPIVHHKDNNKLNNDVSNLSWATYKENSQEYFNLKETKRSDPIE